MVTTPDGANATEGIPSERNSKEKALRLKAGWKVIGSVARFYLRLLEFRTERLESRGLKKFTRDYLATYLFHVYVFSFLCHACGEVGVCSRLPP